MSAEQKTQTGPLAPKRIKLEGCPFCGHVGRAKVLYNPAYDDEKHSFLVSCSFCRSRGPRESSELLAKLAWNSRAVLTPRCGECETRGSSSAYVS